MGIPFFCIFENSAKYLYEQKINNKSEVLKFRLPFIKLPHKDKQFS